MNTVTIPKKITRGEELVVISRKEYERFLRISGAVKVAKKLPTAVEEGLRDLEEGRVSPTFSSAREAILYLHNQSKKIRQTR